MPVNVRPFSQPVGTIRLSMGIEIDLTREQLRPEEIVTGGMMMPRPPGTEWRRLWQSTSFSATASWRSSIGSGDGFCGRVASAA
ncbi:hypothetical protein [Streptomyces sp. NPDC007355]|uniref:hypothetical protein n=1 Tax=Streptomyces sp. NPDC007355 TaxID=3364778 RepID=UPI0036854F67